MHVIAPDRYHLKTKPRRHKPYLRILLGLVLIAGLINYARPLPAPVTQLTVSVPSSVVQPTIAWPGGGQAAIAAAGYGLLGANGDQTPLATASIAKVITALCVLQKQPLSVGESGPTYTVSSRDVAIYNDYVAQDGSVMAVAAGEQLTEYQALEALMIPSANNVADSLVRWVFGSHDAYAAYATAYLQQNGLEATHIGSDASGFEPDTTSTASDLASLGLLALQSPVLLQIASQHYVTLPVAGTVYNYNTVLGQNGITGLKTGNNDADPGAFLFTSVERIGGKDVPLTGAVMGAADLETALQDSVRLSSSLQQGFEQVTVAQTGQAVGLLQTAWGQQVAIKSTKPLQVIRWKGTPITEKHTLRTDIRSGDVGSMQISSGQAKSVSTLRLGRDIPGPSFWWRLTRH